MYNNKYEINHAYVYVYVHVYSIGKLGMLFISHKDIIEGLNP